LAAVSTGFFKCDYKPTSFFEKKIKVDTSDFLIATIKNHKIVLFLRFENIQ